MSKLLNRINEQPEGDDKNEVLKIYYSLKSIDAHVWESDFNCLVKTTFTGTYPNIKCYYKPSLVYLGITKKGFKMFEVHERIGAFSKVSESFDFEEEARDYIMDRWYEAREEALLFHDDLNEDAVMELFLSDFIIKEVAK